MEVEQADNSDKIKISEVFWPAVKLDSLLFSRSGVKISAPAALIREDIATTSVLYWAFRRSYRRVNDLSHGWGHNSQWSTCFRRDYEDSNHYYFNVDASYPLMTGNPQTSQKIDWYLKSYNPYQLTEDQFRELLVYRCLVQSHIEDSKDGDFFPYNFSLKISRKELPELLTD
ncbi:MAG: hypothetical protein K8F91_03965 [Candidatus Obscuribacterales bacterium]|nr:hypothetical protein [Candidatus Obscuribacterales bacterium]